MPKEAKKAAPKKAQNAKKAAPTPEAEAPKKAAKKAAPKTEEIEQKTAASKGPKKAAAKKSKDGGGKANAGLMKPLNISADLAKVIGSDPVPRTQVIKKIWDYIKANNLQDPENKRMINGDAKLKKVFAGKEQVSMFELAKIVNNHVS